MTELAVGSQSKHTIVIFIGIPCEDVYVAENGTHESVIKCVTGPQPYPTDYFPGKQLKINVGQCMYIVGHVTDNT